MRGSPERGISSLHAFDPGVGQISRVAHVSARAPFGVLLQRSSVSVFVFMKSCVFVINDIATVCEQTVALLYMKSQCF